MNFKVTFNREYSWVFPSTEPMDGIECLDFVRETYPTAEHHSIRREWSKCKIISFDLPEIIARASGQFANCQQITVKVVGSSKKYEMPTLTLGEESPIYCVSVCHDENRLFLDWMAAGYPLVFELPQPE